MHNYHLTRHFLKSTVLIGLLSVAINTHAAPAKACPLNPADITKVLSAGFKDGKPQDNPMGTACNYDSKGKLPDFLSDVTVLVSTMPMQGSLDSMKFMLGPISQKYNPVPNDADKAMTITHAPDVPSFPDILYIRGGKLVQVRISGGIYPADKAARKALVDQYNKKLLALPRVP